jgi:hypothetical protein
MEPVARVFTEDEVADFKRIERRSEKQHNSPPLFSNTLRLSGQVPKRRFIAEKLVLKYHRCRRAQARCTSATGLQTPAVYM